ncbi:MAG: hypothetical protein ABR608_12960 [Pseudonocardiaceae bacterium]
MYFEDHGTTAIPVPPGDEEYQATATADATCDGVEDTGPGLLDPGYDTPGYVTDGYDTDGDGRNDTVLITNPAGGSVLLTDVDGDGAADIATEITSEGLITVSEHTGDGQWTVLEHGRLGHDGSAERADDASVGFASSGSDSAGSSSSGSDFAGSSSSSDSAGSSFSDAVVSIDPATGEWIAGCPPPVANQPSPPGRPALRFGSE